ncbi:START domain protein (macronuclear) [Tetrahymena thermophila SB210]|uniref:START domain protein n=1 Tax=Tetrahymena thermophila (strain SB210) TaxID=312017 RepID=Q22NQ2_TETTS|nr:START domain protein [Tetrahymena thermophila SB210]EAR86733.1 START domain protein [Tetrahymena thermophila SB210]|eukprot:XP_001006978.1 START domain protein [Tetrahymena thermophila SB210]
MDQNKYSQISAQAIQNVQHLILDQSEWNILKQGNYLKIFCQKYKNTEAYSFKITGEISADFMLAQKFYFENNEDMAKNRDNCIGIDLIEAVDKDNVVCLIKMSFSTNNMTQREFLVVRNRSFLSNNEILIVNGILNEHSKAPINNNSQREQMAINAQIIKKISLDSCNLEIYFLRDFSKAVPMEQLPLIAEAFLQIFEKDVEKILSQK